MSGPWVAVSRTEWKLEAAEPHGPWFLEYRRAEPGCTAGWYLFGDGFDGKHIIGTAEDVRYKALLKIAALIDKRGKDGVSAILWGHQRGEAYP